MTIKDFLHKHGFHMETRETDRNPWMSAEDPWAQAASHWSCKILFQGKTLLTYFSQGEAHRHWTMLGAMQARTQRGISVRANESVGRFWQRYKICSREERLAWTAPTAPEIHDVMHGIQQDCWGVENSRSFEEWADHYGYDADSRQAEKTYRTCQDICAKLARFMGEALFQEFLETEEE